VENLFDDTSSGQEYPEFRGPRWNDELYPRKLAALSRAIRRSCRGGPDVVLLQEVESEQALLDLRDRGLARLGYRQAVFAPDSTPAAGAGAGAEPITRVAVLSRLPVRRTRLYQTGTFQGAVQRPILEVELEVHGRTLILFNSHWKSKVGGAPATQAGRRLSAEVLARRLRAILGDDPAAEVVVAGDLNLNLEELGSPPLLATAERRRAGLSKAGVRLYDPWYELPYLERGSAVYQGSWQTPDHFLLAPGLLDERGLTYRAGGFRVVRLPFLVHAGSGFPRRFEADSGTSDHLPLLLEIVPAQRKSLNGG
jgi:endonuclease/exonuclease/phosphatase family metal-dependent hydrolase